MGEAILIGAILLELQIHQLQRYRAQMQLDSLVVR